MALSELVSWLKERHYSVFELSRIFLVSQRMQFDSQSIVCNHTCYFILVIIASNANSIYACGAGGTRDR
jgi:hypothetical protein